MKFDFSQPFPSSYTTGKEIMTTAENIYAPQKEAMTMYIQEPLTMAWTAIDQAFKKLTIYRTLLTDPLIATMSSAISDLVQDPTQTNPEQYYYILSRLTDWAENSTECAVGNAWQDYILQKIVEDENPFSLKAASAGTSVISDALAVLVQNDLSLLHQIASIDPREFCISMLGDQLDASPYQWLGFQGDVSSAKSFHWQERATMKAHLFHLPSWQDGFATLRAYHLRTGVGIFGRYKAFRWDPTSPNPLVGIASPDPVTLSEMIGYELAREEVLRNTERLMQGHHANNVLLYGDRGTGKSSTVKAILNAYADQGLRLVEVPRAHLSDFPKMIALLRRYPQRFIVFVDDLSFEDSEWNYKDLKAVLEGGLEVRPQNVVIYATSNRRHLIRERFSDRGTPRDIAMGDEVFSQDTSQEKLSLADRFGITVTFTTPDQEQYLEIVMGLAHIRGLDIDPAVLRRRALQWEMWQNARSGRTAKQFIDYLAAELAMN
jgi:hypothetical protein